MTPGSPPADILPKQRLAVGLAKQKLITLAACVGLTGALATTAVGDALLAPGIAAAQDLAAALHMRSPGTRSTGILLDTKPRHVARVVPPVRPAAPPALFVEQVPDAFAVPVPAPAIEVAELYPPVVPYVEEGPLLAGGYYGGGSFFGGGGFYPGGGGGGGGGSGGGADTGTVPGDTGTTTPGDTGTIPPDEGEVLPPGGGEETLPPVPVDSVPEPATWMTMLVGFGLLGTAMRRRRVRVGYSG